MLARTHVVILAQGKQTRLSGFKIPKQLLPLPAHVACGADNHQIIQRTIMQVSRVFCGGGDLTLGDASRNVAGHHITVLGWGVMFSSLMAARIPYLVQPEHYAMVDFVANPNLVTLPDPGNSSLQGFHRYWFDHQGSTAAPFVERVAVLFGDVVYSWECLRRLIDGGAGDVVFAGTSNLSAEAGELWGISWRRGGDSERMLMQALHAGLAKSSKGDDDVYQPGQLRHWLWAYDAIASPKSPPHGTRTRKWFVPIDDYTMDVDVPEHLIDLARASLEAYRDDREKGVIRRG